MTRLKLRAPKAGQVWCHIDRLSRADGKVWAVQYRGPRGGSRYVCVRAVILAAAGYTQFHGATALQPKAYLVFDGATVTIDGDTATIR